jgi:hypothetical protein
VRFLRSYSMTDEPLAAIYSVDDASSSTVAVADLAALIALTHAQRVVCDVGNLTPSLDAVDLVARLQLAARRLGIELELRHVSKELSDLITLVGLSVESTRGCCS